MVRYCISDGLAASRPAASAKGQPYLALQQVIDHFVDFVQIREKDLTARELLALIEGLHKKQARILVNERFDLALAAGADGVHLPSDSPPPARFRALVTEGFLIAVSCHSIDDVLRAEREDADFVVLGPIFATPSKSRYGEPLGLRVLHQAAHMAAIPVFALGGINEENSVDCARAGAAGIAGIRMFQEW